MRINYKHMLGAAVICVVIVIIVLATTYGESFSNLYKFIPNKDYSGEATINFEVSDSVNPPIPASINFNILPVDDQPVFQPLTLQMDEDKPAVFSQSDFLGSAIDPDNDTLKVENVRYDITGQPIPVQDDKWTITSAPNFNGPLKIFYDVIGYKPDNSYVTYKKDTTITVNPVNDAPVVGELTPINADPNTNIVFDLLKGVSDIDNNNLTISDVFLYKDANEAQGSFITPVNGVYSYNFPTGGKYTIKYNISDGTVTIPRIQLVNINSAPIAPTNLALTANQNIQKNFTVSDLLGNATDPDGSALVVDDVRYIDETGTPLTKNSDGTYIFTNAPNSSTPVTIFYKIGDGKLFTPFKTVVKVLNNPPQGNPTYSAFNAAEDKVFFFNDSNLLQGFTDPNNDVLSINPSSILSQHGNITPSSNRFGIVSGDGTIAGSGAGYPVINFQNPVYDGPIQFLNGTSPTQNFNFNGIYLLGFTADNIISGGTITSRTNIGTDVTFLNFNAGSFTLITNSINIRAYNVNSLNISQYFGTKLTGTLIRNNETYAVVGAYNGVNGLIGSTLYYRMDPRKTNSTDMIPIASGINIPISAGSYIYISNTSAPSNFILQCRIDIGTVLGNSAVYCENIQNGMICYPFQVNSSNNMYISHFIAPSNISKVTAGNWDVANCSYSIIKLDKISRYGVFHRASNPINNQLVTMAFQTTNYVNLAPNSLFISPTSNNFIDIPEDGLYIISYYMQNWNRLNIKINMNINGKIIAKTSFTNQTNNLTTISYLTNGDKFSIDMLLKSTISITTNSIFEKIIIMKIED